MRYIDKKKLNNFIEYGSIGQNKYDGIFMEEFLAELQGRNGIEAYKEMAENDDIVGAILFSIEMLVRQCDWSIEARGNTKDDKKAAKFVESCLNDMQQSWQDTLSEILSFLVYGWSYHEIVYKRRMGKNKDNSLNSKYNDGLIGWKKIPIRSQDTLFKWSYNDEDELIGMYQMAPPTYDIRFIPIEKSLHFITKSRKWNPEGRSILRNAYRSHYFKKRFQEIEGIGVERDLAGLPMLQPPEGIDIWDANDPDMVKALTNAEKLVQNVRRDSKEGIVLPFGWTFSLLTGGSKRQFEIGSIIERYDSRIAMTVMADFIMLGHEMVGSFALSSDKTNLFGVALGTFLDIICEVFNNQAIPRLIDLNYEHFKNISDYPIMKHGDIEKQNITEVASFIKEMTGIGIIVPDENLEKFVRQLGDLPEPLEGVDYPKLDDDLKAGDES